MEETNLISEPNGKHIEKHIERKVWKRVHPFKNACLYHTGIGKTQHVASLGVKSFIVWLRCFTVCL